MALNTEGLLINLLAPGVAIAVRARKKAAAKAALPAQAQPEAAAAAAAPAAEAPEAFTPEEMATIEMVRSRLESQQSNPYRTSSAIPPDAYALYQRWVASQSGRTVAGLGSIYSLRGLGVPPDAAATQLNEAQGDIDTVMTTIAVIGWTTTLVGTAAGAYHGFKRNNTVGWAIGWALLGGLFPVITLSVAAAQGFGKRAK